MCTIWAKRLDLSPTCGTAALAGLDPPGAKALTSSILACDLKHEPLADLCSLGGWKDHNTILKCYMRPDEATMRGALERQVERGTTAAT